jgi:hypothetical protein
MNLFTFQELMEGVKVSTSKKSSFAIKPINVKMLELDDVLYHTNSAVLMPEIPQKDPSAASKQVTGLRAIAMAFKQLEFDPRMSMLIAAHTDTEGAAASNFELSRKRGQSIYNLMSAGKREDWALVSEQQHVVEDYQQILIYLKNKRGWISCDPGPINNTWNAKTKEATKAFIDKYNSDIVNGGNSPPGASALDQKKAVYFIDNDAKHHWPRELWRAVYDLYVADIASELRVDRQQLDIRRSAAKFLKNALDEHYIACGESHPIDAENKDNYRSQKNRRVEIYFFQEKDVTDTWPSLWKYWFMHPCPGYGKTIHGPDICPLWHNLLLKKMPVEDEDLACIGYHLRFSFWDRKTGTMCNMPDGIQMRAFSEVNETAATELKVRPTYMVDDGIYLVKVPDDSNRKHIHFSFNSIPTGAPDTTPRWVRVTIDATAKKATGKLTTEQEIQTQNANTPLSGLPIDKQFEYYDVPARWSSINYFTRYDNDFDKGHPFETVLNNDKHYKPYGQNITSPAEALAFSLDDLVLLDTAGGTQTLRDADHYAPNLDQVPADPNPTTPAAHYLSLNKDSRIKILLVNTTSGRLELYKRGTTEATSRIPFPQNLIIEKNGAIKNARIVHFRDGFYTIGSRRTGVENNWEQQGFVVGARAAVRNDPLYHVRHPMFYNNDEFGTTGDFDLHYFHNLFFDDSRPISFLVYYVSISFIGDTRDWTVAPPHPPQNFKLHTPIPSGSDVQNFVDDRIYNAMEHWNRKWYFFEETVPGPATTVIRPYYFFDERETFKVTPPAAGFHIDFDLRPNHTALFAHAAIQTARQNGRGGRSKYMAFVCQDENGHWGPAYQWSIRNEGPQHYSIIKINLSGGQSWNDVFNPPVPVTEHGESYGAHTFAHELGHATGNPDEYINTSYQPHASCPLSFPGFAQYYVPYSMDTNGTSMMHSNGAPRAHHSWYGLHRINESCATNHHPLQKMLNGKVFNARLDRGGDWIYTFNRHLVATTATVFQKPRRLTDSMKHDGKRPLSATPLKTINLALFDTGRDEASTKYFHDNQTAIEYQAVLVIRLLFIVQFTGAGWTDVDRRNKIDGINFEMNQWRKHYRLIGGTRDLKNIYLHFLAGFSSDVTDADRNYILQLDHHNHPGGSTTRFPNNNGSVTLYNDIPNDEFIRYALNMSQLLGSAQAVDGLRDWVNGQLSETFTSQYF